MKYSLVASALFASASAHSPARRQGRRHTAVARRDAPSQLHGVAYWGFQNGIAGACGGAPHDDSELIVGLSESQWGAMDAVSSTCGKQVSVTNDATGANVVATVTDSCASCEVSSTNSMYLSVAAFDAIGDRDVGMLNITWSFVDGSSGSTAAATPAAQTDASAQATTTDTSAPSQTQDARVAQAQANTLAAQAQPTTTDGADSPAPSSPAPAPSNNNPGSSVGSNAGTSPDGWTQSTSWQGQAILDNFSHDNPGTQCDNGGNCLNVGNGLTWTEGNTAVCGIDGTQNVGFGQRGIARLASTTTYNMENGKLFIFDIAQMPADCGHWPALWMVSRTQQWPAGGEIDIIESANLYTVNVQSVHTGGGCEIQGANMQATVNPGNGDMNNCNAYANPVACGATGTRSGAVGPAFNAGGGGVYALRWDWDGINMHSWARGSVPGDIQSGSPQPSTWGQADYQVPSGGCNPSTNFKDLSIMISNTLGGVMSSGTWSIAGAGNQGQACSDNTGTDPNNFIQNQGGRVAAQSWKFNSINVYTK